MALVEMQRRRKLWNDLVALEREYRGKVAAAVREWEDAHPELRELNAAILDREIRLNDLREEIKERRRLARSGRAEVAKLQEQAKALVEELRAMRQHRKALRGAFDRSELRKMLTALDAECITRANELARNSGLYWPNYGEVLDAWQVARRKSRASGNTLHYHDSKNREKVTVRYQYGLPVSEALACRDTRLQIEPVPEEAFTSPCRGLRRKLARTRIRIRVGSDESRRPVWLELPMVMHRPLPPNGKIRTASILREKIADTWRWKAVITVHEANSVCQATNIDRSIRAVGVDVGWRVLERGLRVAYWYDTDGNHGELIIPEETLHEFRRLRDLQSIRQQNFNETCEWLTKWCGVNALPEWFNIASVRFPRQLAVLFKRWNESRFDGDEEAFDRLADWHRKDLHLWRWQEHLRDQILRRRREQYRIFAASLARNYDAVAIEDLDMPGMIRKPDPENGTLGSLPEDWYRQVASLYSLREAIKNACTRDKVMVLEVPPEMTTLRCHVCGHEERFDAACQIRHTCSNCGALWDQDYNAARNILERGLSQIAATCEQEMNLRKKPKFVRRKRRS